MAPQAKLIYGLLLLSLCGPIVAEIIRHRPHNLARQTQHIVGAGIAFMILCEVVAGIFLVRYTEQTNAVVRLASQSAKHAK
jgi:hypothetical protein